MGLFEWIGESMNPKPIGSIEKETNGPKPPYKFGGWAWGGIAILITLYIYYKVVFEEITSQNWQDRIPFFIVISLYLFASFWISVKPNYQNVGWLGGLINHPFRISDNFNRSLIFLQIILLPGKLISQGIVVLWKLLQQNRQSDNVH